jgi:hypothetical protein
MAKKYMTAVYRLFVLLLLISSIVCGQASDSNVLLPIIQNGKMGFISRTGEIVIQPQFEVSTYLGVAQLSEFSEGMAAVKSHGLIGYIDTSGGFVIAAQFREGRKFSEGLAAVRIGDLWGYINQRGLISISPQFKHTRDFSEGLAQVEMGGKLGYIDKTGKVVIEPRFRLPEYPGFFGDDGGDFRDGIANVHQDTHYNDRPYRQGHRKVCFRLCYELLRGHGSHSGLQEGSCRAGLYGYKWSDCD